MSYGVQFRCTHKAQTNNIETTFRVDILKNGYSGAVTEVLGTGDVFNLEYEKINATEPLKEPIQKGRLDFNILVQGSTEENLLTDIFEANEGTYQMALYRDDTLIWKGYVLNDLLEISQADYPFEAKISAKDFTRLEQFEFPLSSIRRKVITTIGDLLNDLDLGLGFKVYPNWTHEEISGDILGNIYLDERQLRDFGEIGEGAEFDEDDRSLTHDKCLELILKSFGMIIRQSEGYYRLFHLSALTDTSTTEYTYDSTSALISTQTVNLVKSVDRSSRFILPSSQTNFNAGLKRASATLVHNTAQTEIKFDRNIVLIEGETEQEENTQFFNSNGKQTLRFKTRVSAEDINSTLLFRNPQAVIRIFIDGPTDYYLTRQGDWVTDETDIIVNLTSYIEHTVGLDRYYEFFSNLEIESTTIPTSADGTLTVQLNLATHSTANFPQTVYSTPEFEIISEEDAENSVNIAYELVSDANFSKSYNHGTIAFGDGPTPYSPSALYYGTADGERTDGGWSFVGSSDKKGIQRLLLEEIMNMQSQATRNLRAQLYGNFDPHELISYESRQYLFLGGSLNGNNIWSADFLQLNFVEPSVSFEELADAKKGGGFTGASSGTVESFWSLIKQSQFFNTIFLSNYVGELSVPITAKSTITSFTANLFAEITEGEDFIIVDKENERPFFVNVVGQYNTGEDVEVTIEEQFISNDLPVGSPIILSGGLLQSYFRIDPNKLQIAVTDERRGDGIGTIESTLDSGTYTSIELYEIDQDVQLLDSTTLILVNNAGKTRKVTVNGDQTLSAGSDILTVDSFTIATGEPDFPKDVSIIKEPSYSSSSRISLTDSSITSVVERVDDNDTAISSITQSVTDINATTVLKTDFNGNIAQFRLDSDSGGSSISINADQITVAGQTTFLSALQDNLTFPEGSVVIRSATEPTVRPDGEALQEGDVWIETDEGDRPYSWNGSSWTRQFTQIDGGLITTGTIDAERVFAQNISIPSGGSIQSTVYNAGPGGDGFKINADGSAEFRDVTMGGVTSSFGDSASLIDLNVTGTLTMGAGGEITNSGGDYTIDDDGLRLEAVSAGVQGDPNAIRFVSTTGTAVAEMRAFKEFITVGIDIFDEHTLQLKATNGSPDRDRIRLDADIVLINNDLDVNGDIECTTLTETSDRYQKENIEDIGPTLDKIVQLSGKRYDMLGPSTTKNLGLLAQDVEELFPEVVRMGSGENEEGERIEYKTLSYTQLIPALIESIKELKQEIDQLKNEQGI